jgi:hypothetical protein
MPALEGLLVRTKDHAVSDQAHAAQEKEEECEAAQLSKASPS